jgi:hypothetical protein
MKLVDLEDYDRELAKMEKTMKRMEAYMEEHPERLGYAGNYKTLTTVHDIISKERAEYVEKLSLINLNLKGGLSDRGLPLSNLTDLNRTFNQAENILNHANEELVVKTISEGLYKITYAFKNPTDEDVKRTSSRKKALLKIFDFIRCGDDIEKLKKTAGPEGKEALLKYKEFLAEIVKNDADFTLDTEKGSLKAGLTLEQSKNICQKLKI